MNILDAIVNAQGGAAVRQLGREVASRAATQTGLSARCCRHCSIRIATGRSWTM